MIFNLLANTHSVIIRQVDNPIERFAPFPIVIVSGETIEWINNDNKEHTIIGIQQNQPNDLFHTKTIKPNEKSKD